MKIVLDKERVVIAIEMSAEEFTQFDRAMFLQMLASMGSVKNVVNASMIKDLDEFKKMWLPRE